jgi:hypothetical protein
LAQDGRYQAELADVDDGYVIAAGIDPPCRDPVRILEVPPVSGPEEVIEVKTESHWRSSSER